MTDEERLAEIREIVGRRGTEHYPYIRLLLRLLDTRETERDAALAERDAALAEVAKMREAAAQEAQDSYDRNHDGEYGEIIAENIRAIPLPENKS